MADYVDDDSVDIIDPGTPLFLGTLLFCVFSLLSLPIFVAIGNWRAGLRRPSKSWHNQGQFDKCNLDTLAVGKSSFDEISDDGCCGCFAFEGMLECERMGDNNQLTASNNKTSDDFIRTRKRKSTDDIPFTFSVGLDESKRTRRHISDDMSCVSLARQHSFSIGVDDVQHERVTPGIHDPYSLKMRKKEKKKRYYKRAVRAITKKQPIRPLSQTQHVPKITFLDGGFYAPGNLRLHHQVLQFQLDRENQAAKKRRKEKKAKSSYVPPSIPTTKTDSCGGFDHIITHDSTFSKVDDNKSVNGIEDLVFGDQSPYHPNKIKTIWDHVVRIAQFDHESKRLADLMFPYTFTALICNMFAIIGIAIISSVLGAESLSAYLVTGYFLSMVNTAAKGFTDAQATLCAHAVGAGNYFLAGQYIQLTQIVFVLTGFLPLCIMGSFMYQILVWLDVSSDVATLGGSFAPVQVIAMLVDGFNSAQMQFLSAIDPSIYSNVIEILMNASYTAGIAVYLYRNANNNAMLVDLAWIKLCVAVIFIPINIIVLSMRGWLDLCWVGMVRSNALKNKQAVKQMLKTGVPLGMGSLIRESEWGLLVLFASYIGTDDVATFAVVRRTSDIFSSLIEGLCCGAELRCAYHMGRGNQLDASRSAYKSLIIGMSVGTALAFAFYGLLGSYVFELLDYDQIGAEMTQLIPLLCLSSIVMTIGMLGWALLGAQGRVRLATFVTMVTSWIVTIPIAATFVFVTNCNLQGLVAALTMGYSVSSTIIMYLLIRSNWTKRSAKVMKITSSSVSSFSDDESTLASNNGGNDGILDPAPAKSTRLTMDLTISIPSILSLDSDVTDSAIQSDEAVQPSRPIQSDAEHHCMRRTDAC